MFPDVYFVIGAKNSGGTVFNDGLIIGAEMFGEPTTGFNPIVNIDYLDEVVVHELIHFQQNYPNSISLLDQCVREGSADFLCELIAGDHSNKTIHEYGEANIKVLWIEFLKEESSNDWTNWLYNKPEKPRPADLGYWIGYKITKAFYDNMADKEKAIVEILNISDFSVFFEKSEYNGQ